MFKHFSSHFFAVTTNAKLYVHSVSIWNTSSSTRYDSRENNVCWLQKCDKPRYQLSKSSVIRSKSTVDTALLVTASSGVLRCDTAIQEFLLLSLEADFSAISAHSVKWHTMYHWLASSCDFSKANLAIRWSTTGIIMHHTIIINGQIGSG